MNIASPQPPRPAVAVDSSPADTRAGRPSREEAEAAVRTLLRWACDDPNREGLLDTPARVVRSYDDFFAGYHIDPVAPLERTFDEVRNAGHQDLVHE